MFPDRHAYLDVMRWWEEGADAVERRWFLETFYPHYDLICECMRDLQELSEFDNINRSADGRRYFYTIADVCARNQVGEEWLSANVQPLLPPNHDRYTYRAPAKAGGNTYINQAARAYATYLAEQEPLMPISRILTRIHEFVPNYSTCALRTHLNRSGLNTPERQAVSVLANRSYHQSKTDDEYEAYVDSLYLGDDE